MAKTGMRYVVAAQLKQENEGAMPTYENGMVIGRGISAEVSLTRTESKLYADDVLAESENAITGGNISIGMDDILEEAQELVFGLVRTGEEGSYEYDDKAVGAPYVGVGYVQERRYKGVTSYLPYWYYKVQFAPVDDRAQTRGENVEWQTMTASGTMMGVIKDSSQIAAFRTHKVCATAEEAIAWLRQMAGISA
jgi:phi13 family phage major tail protein